MQNRYMHINAPQSEKFALINNPKVKNLHFGNLNKCTLEEVAVFNIIKENTKITQKEIAAKIKKTERTVKTICAKLIEKDIITRKNGKRYGEWVVAENAGPFPEARDFSDAELNEFLEGKGDLEKLRSEADSVRRKIYGDEVFARGLIEFSNFCKNDCYYCGIRASNKKAERYRLTKDEILRCCAQGYELGYRTFVLQSGEDLSYSDDDIAQIVRSIKSAHVDCAVTLSIGEKPRSSYQKFFDAGADRYLLRHETASEEHYKKLHPPLMSLQNRKRCLFDLKEIGFQVGAGFMVGSPFQTNENIIEDLRFLQKLQPDMIGIGPFVTHCETPFANYKNGSVKKTLILLSIIRLMFPHVLLPATTALGTLDTTGREKGLKAGANVLMPNLSPAGVRKKYSLYDGKICTGEEAVECSACLARRVQAAGYKIVVDRGDVRN